MQLVIGSARANPRDLLHVRCDSTAFLNPTQHELFTFVVTLEWHAKFELADERHRRWCVLSARAR